MKLESLTVLSVLLVGANAHGHNHARHAHIAARQNSASTAPASSAAAAASSSVAVSGAPTSAATAATSAPAVASNGVAPLSQITSGMPPDPTRPVATTFTPGATPSFSGAPPLPTKFVFSQNDWPQLDKHAPTDTDLVKEWMKELEGWDIPDLEPTNDGDCSLSPEAAADAANRGWWTCGGYTRDTDIVTCPDKYTWGGSFDDGPSEYSKTLLDYLDEKDIRSTFFVVGSRVVSKPDVLIEEYMKGHEISAHTWSHPPLTSLTTEGVVAELGYAREAIKRVLGVTPTTMRPPYGDIDDRVRAISLAMGLRPIMWTSTGTPGGFKFDTNDWRVAAGQMDGEQQFASFQAILGNASTLNTGFIVLQHDLFDITVKLATGYTLNAALTHDPKFTIEPIGMCNNIPMTDMYMETTTNQTYLDSRKKATANVDQSVTNSTGKDAASGNTKTNAGSAGGNSSGASPVAAVSSFAALVAAGLAIML